MGLGGCGAHALLINLSKYKTNFNSPETGGGTPYPKHAANCRLLTRSDVGDCGNRCLGGVRAQLPVGPVAVACAAEYSWSMGHPGPGQLPRPAVAPEGVVYV